MTAPLSERAMTLLDRFLKMAEPGGAFAFQTEARDQAAIDEREDFINEVVGVLQCRELGRAPPETQIEACKIGLREATFQLLTFCDRNPFGRLMNPADAARTVSNVGMLAAEMLHYLGVDDKVANVRPTTDEIARIDANANCNCKNCVEKRAKEARK